jgi:hypothetical protein
VEGIIQTEKRFVRDAGDLSVLSFFLKQKGECGQFSAAPHSKNRLCWKVLLPKKKSFCVHVPTLSLFGLYKSRFHMAWEVKGEIQRTGKIKSEREEEFGGAPFF